MVFEIVGWEFFVGVDLSVVGIGDGEFFVVVVGFE